MKSKAKIVLTTTLLVTCASTGVSGAAGQQDAVKSAVDKAVQPVMAKYEIPGMAVGMTVGGKHHVFDYGVASMKTGKPVTNSTLFEIGSGEVSLLNLGTHTPGGLPLQVPENITARRDRSSAIKSLMPIQFTWQILCLSPGG